MCFKDSVMFKEETRSPRKEKQVPLTGYDVTEKSEELRMGPMFHTSSVELYKNRLLNKLDGDLGFRNRVRKAKLPSR